MTAPDDPSGSASLDDLPSLTYDAAGLIPAVVQDATTREILMVGYMNAESLRMTLEKNLVTFWSRSRQEFWTKGETSGNVLRLTAIHKDCDVDALLVTAEPAGPTCHTGHQSCFYRELHEDEG